MLTVRKAEITENILQLQLDSKIIINIVIVMNTCEYAWCCRGLNLAETQKVRREENPGLFDVEVSLGLFNLVSYSAISLSSCGNVCHSVHN